MQLDGNNLMDIRSGALILSDLTTAEKVMLATGLTPIRVKTERDLHRAGQVGEMKLSDERGGLVDYIALKIIALETAEGAEAAKLDAQIEAAIERAIASDSPALLKDLEEAIDRRVAWLRLTQEERDILGSPEMLRPDVIEKREQLNPQPEN